MKCKYCGEKMIAEDGDVGEDEIWITCSNASTENKDHESFLIDRNHESYLISRDDDGRVVLS